MAAREGVLAIDVGTTSAKAVLFGLDGTVIADARQGYPLLTPQPGWAVQDPDQVLDAALAAARGALAGANTGGAGRGAGPGGSRTNPANSTAVACGLSTAMHTLLGLDAHLRPVTPLLTWADGRAAGQAEWLRTDPVGRDVAGRSGTPLHPMSPLAKLIWFRQEDPETFARARHWVGIKEYLLLRLCGGSPRVDRSIASTTGLFDVIAGDWDGAALDLAGVRRNQLGTLLGATDRAGTTIAGSGLPVGIPVIAGGSDGALANIGVGAIAPGTLACSIGTSAALRITVDRPAVDPAGRLFCYVLDDAHWIVGGATNNGGNMLRWLHEAIAPELPADTAEQTLLDVAERAPAGAEGLLMLPYLAGERAPRWAGNQRAVYFGLTQRHRREHLVRAGLEGVCLQLALVLGVMEGTGQAVREVRATGGFARSGFWRQLLVDVLGREVGFPVGTEGSALGAAVLALRALGLAGFDPVRVAETVTPGADASVYKRLVPLYSRLADAVQPLYQDRPGPAR